MTNKEKLFNSLVKKWVKKTWLGWWTTEVVFKDAIDYQSNSEFNCENSLAYCDTSWAYMHAKIIVNSTLLEKMDTDTLEFIVVHELMHIILNEMREEGIEHEERVATVLANSFLLTERTSKC